MEGWGWGVGGGDGGREVRRGRSEADDAARVLEKLRSIWSRCARPGRAAVRAHCHCLMFVPRYDRLDRKTDILVFIFEKSYMFIILKDGLHGL